MTRSAGFTLLEVLIVIGISGLLLAIAIPNFNASIEKAKDSSAKILMATGYAVNKSMFIEYGTYNACFNQMGMYPEGMNTFGFHVNVMPATGPSDPNVQLEHVRNVALPAAPDCKYNFVQFPGVQFHKMAWTPNLVADTQPANSTSWNNFMFMAARCRSVHDFGGGMLSPQIGYFIIREDRILTYNEISLFGGGGNCF